MKTIKDTLATIESKIMPINQVDHRFRLQHLTFGMDGISIQATLLTSNEQDYNIQCNYAYSQKTFNEWIMMDYFGSEFQVTGIVSKTLYYFARKSTGMILEAMGYEFIDTL